jgi:hypothetical protein
MSKIWLNGRITGHELKTLHALEYRKILAERQKALEVTGAEAGSAQAPAP